MRESERIFTTETQRFTETHREEGWKHAMANDSGKQSDELMPSKVPQSAFCGSLRSKKFFMRDALPNEASDYLDGSNHCWCRVTQQVIGPDGAPANPDSCGRGRTCYSSAFEA